MPDTVVDMECRDSTIMRDVSAIERESLCSMDKRNTVTTETTVDMQEADATRDTVVHDGEASVVMHDAERPVEMTEKPECAESLEDKTSAAQRLTVAIPRPYLSIQVGDEDYVEHHGASETCAATGYHPDSSASNQSAARSLGLFSSPTSCRSNASRASQVEYANADQTIILFDWDDTLCPSTYMMRTLKLGVFDKTLPRDLKPQLDKLENMVIDIINEALTQGCVVIVTNAEEGWIDLSAKAWLPRVWHMLKRCKVVSARSKWEPQGIASPAGWKQKTFYEEIDTFYSRYKHQSWKNVISVGDAPHEREALFRVTQDRSAAECARRRKCRTKAIKFMIRPTVSQLIHELKMLQRCLQQVVTYDDNLDLQFDENSLPPSEPCKTPENLKPPARPIRTIHAPRNEVSSTPTA